MIRSRPSSADGQLVHDLESERLELLSRYRALEERHRALESSHRRYVEFCEALPTACCRLDAEGRIELVNPAAAALFGVDRLELTGQHLWDVMPRGPRSELRSHVVSCFLQKRLVSTSLELPVARLGDVAFEVVSAPLLSVDRTLIGCETVLNDVSSLKRAEQRLRLLADASSLLSATFETRETVAAVVRSTVPGFADLGFIDLVDDDGQVRRLEVAAGNPEQHGLAEAMRDSSRVRPLPAVPALINQGADEALAAAVGPGPEHLALVKALSPRSVMLVPVVLRGQPFGCLGLVMTGPGRTFGDADLQTAVDLAARIAMSLDSARAYQAAKRAMQARQDVLSVVSHDLKTPLTGIQLCADAMLRSTPPDDRRRSHIQVDRIRASTEHMQRLIDDLLDLSSIDAGRLSVDRHEHGLAALICDAVAMLEPHATEKGLALVHGPVDEHLRVQCDRHRVLQVFSNLVGNAVKFTPRGGRIEISADFHEGQARISVRDDGPGISPQVMRRLFERHWQAKETASLGKGLGLYISKGIIETQGGHIWVDSRLGEGTTVHFTLPPALPAMVAAPLAVS